MAECLWGRMSEEDSPPPPPKVGQFIRDVLIKQIPIIFLRK